MESKDTENSIPAKTLESIIEIVILLEQLEERTNVEILEVIPDVISEEAEVKSIRQRLDEVISSIATSATFGQVEEVIPKTTTSFQETIVVDSFEEVLSTSCLQPEYTEAAYGLVSDIIEERGEEAAILLDSNTIPGWNDEDLLEFVKDYSPEQLVTNFGDSFLFTDDVLTCNNLLDVTPDPIGVSAAPTPSVFNCDSDNPQLQSDASEMSDSVYSLRLRPATSEKSQNSKKVKSKSEIAKAREAKAERQRIREANRKLFTFINDCTLQEQTSNNYAANPKKGVQIPLAGFSNYTTENTERFKNSRFQKPTFLFTFPPLPPPTYDKFMARKAEIERFEEAFSDRKKFEILLQNEEGELVSFERISGSPVEISENCNDNISDTEDVKPVILETYPKPVIVETDPKPGISRGFGFRTRRGLPNRVMPAERQLSPEYVPPKKRQRSLLPKPVALKPKSSKSLLKPIEPLPSSTSTTPHRKPTPLKTYSSKRSVLPSQVFSTSQKRVSSPEPEPVHETKDAKRAKSSNRSFKSMGPPSTSTSAKPSSSQRIPLLGKPLRKEPPSTVPEHLSSSPSLPDVPKKIKLSYRDLTAAQILEIKQVTKPEK